MVEDLRSAVEELKKYENQIACTDTEVDSYAEVAGIYRYVLKPLSKKVGK